MRFCASGSASRRRGFVFVVKVLAPYEHRVCVSDDEGAHGILRTQGGATVGCNGEIDLTRWLDPKSHVRNAAHVGSRNLAALPKYGQSGPPVGANNNGDRAVFGGTIDSFYDAACGRSLVYCAYRT